MLEAGGQHAEHVQCDQADRQVGQDLVHLLDPLGAPVGVGRHHESGRAGAGEHGQQSEDHGAAGGIVADVARRPEQCDVAQVGEHLARRAHEAFKARVPRSDDPPHDAQRQQGRDRVARRDVDFLDLVAGRISHHEKRGQRPMEDPHEQVPDLDRCRRRRAAGFDRVVHDGHCADRQSLPTMSPLVGLTNSSTRLPALSIV